MCQVKHCHQELQRGCKRSSNSSRASIAKENITCEATAKGFCNRLACIAAAASRSDLLGLSGAMQVWLMMAGAPCAAPTSDILTARSCVVHTTTTTHIAANAIQCCELLPTDVHRKTTTISQHIVSNGTALTKRFACVCCYAAHTDVLCQLGILLQLLLTLTLNI